MAIPIYIPRDYKPLHPKVVIASSPGEGKRAMYAHARNRLGGDSRIFIYDVIYKCYAAVSRC